MNATVDLRTTLGWRLSSHARTTTRDRAVPIADVLTVIADPEVTYTAYDYGPGRHVYQRGDLAVVVAPDTQEVITVLWRRQEQWTDAEFAARESH